MTSFLLQDLTENLLFLFILVPFRCSKLHVIHMLRIFHVIPLRCQSDHDSKSKTSFHFESFVIPAPSLLWSSPRPISDSQLHVLPHFHLCPIYLVVFKGSYWITPGISYLKGGFTLRCLQRLSLPNLATRLCHWHDNRCTRGQSNPVLSY